jgi:hypothetical protein
VIAEARGEINSEPTTMPAVSTKKQSSRFILISLFIEDGIGDTETP